MKTEKHSRRARRGLTLVELIVVLAVIVLVIGIAVPGIVSLASLGRGDFGNSARNLLGALRAAKMYSSTYRTITAVAYVYNEAYDSVLFVPATAPPEPLAVPVLEGFALVRKAVDRQEAVKLAEVWTTHPDFNGSITFDDVVNRFMADNVYFTLQNPEGGFREFGRDAVVLSIVNRGIDTADTPNIESNLRNLVGLNPIRILDPGSWTDIDADGYPDDVPPTVTLYAASGNPDLFPAHVYSPTGAMRIGGAAPERITIEIGPSPELADNYRFGRDLSSNEISTTNADEDGEPLAQAEVSIGRRFLEPILIQLYQSTGRVNWASEGM